MNKGIQITKITNPFISFKCLENMIDYKPQITCTNVYK